MIKGKKHYAKTHKISVVSIAYGFLFFPFFEVLGILENIPFMMQLNRAWQWSAALVMLFLSIRLLPRIRPSVMLWFYLAFVLQIILSTFLSNGEVFAEIKYYIPITLFFLFFDLSMQRQPTRCVEGLFFCLTLIIILNFLTVIRGGILPEFKEMIYDARIYFIGSKNKSTVFLLLGQVIIQLENQILQKYKKMGYIIMFLGLITPVLTHSTQGLVSSVILLVGFTVSKMDIKITKYINYKNAFISAAFITIVVLTGRVGIFSAIIENVLHKDMTLTGRTMIWSKAYELIKKRPLWGYGNNTELIYIDTIYEKNVQVNAHSDYLQFLLYGGIILLSIVILMLLIVAFKQYDCDKSIVICLSSGFFMVLVLLAIDNLQSFTPLYILLFIIFHSSGLNSRNLWIKCKRITCIKAPNRI